MKKLILIAALAALSGTAYADTQSDVFKCLKPSAATHPGAF